MFPKLSGSLRALLRAKSPSPRTAAAEDAAAQCVEQDGSTRRPSNRGLYSRMTRSVGCSLVSAGAGDMAPGVYDTKLCSDTEFPQGHDRAWADIPWGVIFGKRAEPRRFDLVCVRFPLHSVRGRSAHNTRRGSGPRKGVASCSSVPADVLLRGRVRGRGRSPHGSVQSISFLDRHRGST